MAGLEEGMNQAVVHDAGGFKSDWLAAGGQAICTLAWALAVQAQVCPRPVSA